MSMRIGFVPLFLVVLSACGSDAAQPVTTAAATPQPSAPAVTSANGVVAAIAGSVFSYDASKGGATFSDPAARGLTYGVSFSGSSNGLLATGCILTGTPSTPGVTTATVTATDALGRSVSNQFMIVTFAAGLATPVLPATSFRYTDAANPFPAHFNALVNGSIAAATDNTPPDNPITDAGATLGRVLFHDPRLSGNDGTACSSCHLQSLGFGDVPQFSVGFLGAATARHAPALVNARFYQRKAFFWDERAATLEAQVLLPIQNSGEMGLTLDALALKLSVTPYYAALFTAAFGTEGVTSNRIARALAQYVRSLTSSASRFDKAFSATGVANFAGSLTLEEQLGEQLFRSSGCASCHTTTLQVGDSIHNIGLEATLSDTGAGRGAFKVPSLRNVALRSRYMHDGRFSTLEEVVEFFNSGVKASAGLDPRLKATDGTPKRLALTSTQKAALVAFLGTLTDSAFLTDARFSNPFVIAPTTPPATSAAAVTIQNTSYKPPSLTVSPGTVVTWTNLDNTRHSAQFDSPAITSTPIFSSGSRTAVMPILAGTYTYHCAIHGLAMSGSITVK